MGSLTSFNLSRRRELLTSDSEYRGKISLGVLEKCQTVNSSTVIGSQGLDGKYRKSA